ncbi:MAG TPA: rod shape-determining protein RodA [Caldithrix abyssi]|uniref:Peptidoglycan glycosyltransferase RodA n=1 Tax=Caldithrix abyssi TaxID=187145 RepID=A0A7V1LL29_CALAY|nr:rod shape-determining protein RodA [Caldithrix abyssi]
MRLKIDYNIAILVALLLTIGLIAVYSATSSGSGESLYFQRQVMYAVTGFLIMLIMPYVSFRFIERASYLFYALAILMLVLVSVIGVKGFGAERWLAVGPVKIQPSEFAKMATVMAVARYLSDRGVNVNRLKAFFTVTVIIMVPFLLIIKQPDLGTSLVFLALYLPLLFWAGLNGFALFLIISPVITVLTSFNNWVLLVWLILISGFLYFSRKKWLILITIVSVHVGIGFATPYMWDQLHDYQKNRIETFLNPEHDPRGAGYQIIQSQVAIGSGGVWGKGFLNGTQTHLKFLPAQHTDFIFSVIAEEWGLVGVTAVLLLFLILLIYLIGLASTVKSRFASMTLVGVTAILFFHIFVNIGMTVGVAPVTGLPLPLISYGGSFLLSTMLMLGIVQNLSYNRYQM